MQFNGVIHACRGVRCDRLPPGGGNTQFQSFAHILLGWHISLWVGQNFKLYCKISWKSKVYNCTKLQYATVVVHTLECTRYNRLREVYTTVMSA